MTIQGNSQRLVPGYDSYGAKVQTSVVLDNKKTAHDADKGDVKVDKNGVAEDGTKYLTVAERDQNVKRGYELANSVQAETKQAIARQLSSIEAAVHTNAVQDGVWTKAEVRENLGAKRDKVIAKAEAEVEAVRKDMGGTIKRLHADGKLDPNEQKVLEKAEAKLQKMESALAGLKKIDGELDANDTAIRSGAKGVAERTEIVKDSTGAEVKFDKQGMNEVWGDNKKFRDALESSDFKNKGFGTG